MSNPQDVKAHTDAIEAMFGRAALLAADSKGLRERAKEDAAKADAYEAQAIKLRADARALVAKGPECGCGEKKKREALDRIDAEADALEASPAVLPPTATVDSSAKRTGTTEARRHVHVHGLRGAFGHALASQGITTLDQLAAKTEAELRAPLGEPAGKFADAFVGACRTALRARGLDLAAPPVLEEAPAEEPAPAAAETPAEPTA